MDNIKKLYKWWKQEWSYLLGIVLFLFIVAGFVSIMIYIVRSYNEKNAKTITDLLQIIFAWPTLGILGFFVFIKKFSSSIEIFLGDHKPKVPGTDERQQEQKVENVKIDGENKELPVDNPKQVEKVEELKVLLDESNKEKAQTAEQLKSQEALLEIYEFNYLALFFVDTTKRVLKWFFDLKDKSIITYESYNLAWQSIILDPGQRATVFNVLQQYGMISGVTGGAFSITEKGEKLLRFIGFVK